MSLWEGLCFNEEILNDDEKIDQKSAWKNNKATNNKKCHNRKLWKVKKSIVEPWKFQMLNNAGMNMSKNMPYKYFQGT